MEPVRVLVVDDSAVIRMLLSDLLASDSGIVVAGTAADGKQALAAIAKLKPDLVTLDIEMPVMDGLETLLEIRKLYPRLPVIMVSSFTERGAVATLDALSKGASDYVTKPSYSKFVEGSRERVAEDLIRKIKGLCAPPLTRLEPRPLSVSEARPLPPRIDVVALGASTGGPRALAALIPLLPSDFPVPVVIVQHMPPMFTRLLAERLNACASLEVKEGTEGQKLQSGQVWIAPGDRHMTVTRKGREFVLGLNNSSPENSCRPAVDVLFRSVAQACGANVLAVVLTGMGNDGTRGAAEIHEAGGQVIVQDEATSVVWGMPGSVVAARMADLVCPLGAIGQEIVRRASIGREVGLAAYS